MVCSEFRASEPPKCPLLLTWADISAFQADFTAYKGQPEHTHPEFNVLCELDIGTVTVVDTKTVTRREVLTEAEVGGIVNIVHTH